MITTEELYNLFLNCPGISTDSRKVIPGSVFFALKGDYFDGNRFARDALEKDAAFAVVDNPEFAGSDRCIPVENTLKSLHELAKLHRSKISATILGITGSNGKTTTKELIGRVLACNFKTVITQGNLNNHIGVPLSLLAIQNNTEIAVIEMGANHPGEIAELCNLARPHFGIITNIGKAHLQGFGGYEGVIRAKSELYQFIRKNQGHVFVNHDDSLLMDLSDGMNRISYGSTAEADIKGIITERDPYLLLSWAKGRENGRIKTTLFGDYNFSNIMAAVTAGLYFGVKPIEIDQAIAGYIPDNNRSQRIQTKHNIIILDAYNANPSSMKAALLNFSKISAGNKMVILGDMMELGDHSESEHENILNLAADLSFETILLIGDQFAGAGKKGKTICFSRLSEAESWLSDHPVKNSTILIKGSRKMQLEKLAGLL